MDEIECDHSVAVDIETLHAQERKNKVKIDEKFQAVKCYRNIFGTASSFKLVVNRGGKYFIHPLDETESPTSPTLFIGRHTKPATFRMCIKDKSQPEFVTFVCRNDNVTVFSPEVKEPIGRVVRKQAEKIVNDKSDIFCHATNMKFTMKNFELEDEGPSMKIFNSNGSVVAAASVCKVTTTMTENGSIRQLKEFIFHFNDNISEPMKVLFLVAFSNWARWSCREANGRTLPISFCTCLLVLVFLFLLLVFLVWLVKRYLLCKKILGVCNESFLNVLRMMLSAEY